MVVSGEPNINNIMGGIENTGGVRLHNHKKKLKQRFDIIKKLGQGTYGKVQLGINKETGQEVAIKTIKKSKIETEADLIRIRREIQIMSSVQHPNIIHIYEVFENREKMILVMEYAAGGELYDYLSERKVLSEDEARRIFRQISIACYYCHKHKICHRDLKLENILLDENGNAKIADFGLSNIFDDQRLLSTYCGSPLYASPEIVKGTPYQGPEVDCWSLGVLLYTLVYGAMPFDGSNFKRLVKQISQGDYFEPKKPSRASPLIREMLTVNPKYRANVQKICSHWWVNEGYEENCLDVSEELANQTPVRLDLLLSLAPPGPQLESEKLMVTGEIEESNLTNDTILAPTRSQSVGSLRELSQTTDLRIKDLVPEDIKSNNAKRKLESSIGTDLSSIQKDDIKRKEKISKERTVADVTSEVITTNENNDTSMTTAPLDKSSTRTITKKMEIDNEENIDPSKMGAACAEIIEDSKNRTKNIKSPAPEHSEETTKDKKIAEKDSVTTKIEKEGTKSGKENEKKVKRESKTEESRIPAKKKVSKKKVLTDKNENLVESKIDTPSLSEKYTISPTEKLSEKLEENAEEEKKAEKPVERRRSKIFETAEKFQNLISSNDKLNNEKSKKIVIPGVSVGGFKKEFERKASLSSSSNVPQLKNSTSKKIVEKQTKTNQKKEETNNESSSVKIDDTTTENIKKTNPIENNSIENVVPEKNVDEKKKKAVSIISTALDKEGTRKSKSRPCVGRKPPIPFGSSGRSASGNIGIIPEQFDSRKEVEKLPLSPPVSEQVEQESVSNDKVSSAEITLKSATLPRRKQTKAEINLKYPIPKPAVMEFKTEMAHNVEPASNLLTQRSEIIFPISPASGNIRSSSLDAENRSKQSRERIIPISYENEENSKDDVQSPTSGKPPSRVYQTRRSSASRRSESLSRQSTQESDSDTTSLKGEPIRKSPREYIIPIAVEGGGYVTPRAGSLEPSETGSTTSTVTNRSKFGRAKRMSSLINDREGSEDESAFSSAIPRRNSFGKDSDTEDSKKDLFRMHSLRSSRPRKVTLEHNDSFSSGEDDDDDGFEILTAENLFSTLLSRVRDLTSRLNVEDSHPGFPRSSLLTRNFLNFPNRFETLSRRSPLGRAFSREHSSDGGSGLGTPWRRSVTRDLSSDLNRVFNSSESPTHTATLPRGGKNKTENLNLLDLDLKKFKFSKEDALALSYLTPGLSRRIQKQLLARFPSPEIKKLSRTMSMKEPPLENDSTNGRRNSYDVSVEQSLSSPRRFTETVNNKNSSCSRSFLEPMQKDSTIPTTSSKYDLSAVYEPTTRTTSRFKTNELAASTSSFSRHSDFARSPSRDSYSSTVDEKCPTSDTECFTLDSFRRNRAARSASLRGSSLKPDYLLPKPSSYVSYTSSTDSSVSNALSGSSKNNCLSDFADSSRRESISISPSRYEISDCSESEKSKQPKRSRFLRSNFFDGRNDDPVPNNPYLREKKEREMETQKVLKEIRDKRKSKMRERSASRERERRRTMELAENITENNSLAYGDDSGKENRTTEKNNSIILLNQSENILTKSTENLLKNVSDNIKNLETSVGDIHDYVNLKPFQLTSENDDGNQRDNLNLNKEPPISNTIHDYVNLTTTEMVKNNLPKPYEQSGVQKKERISKIARPKSYPTESMSNRYVTKIPTIAENDENKSKICKLKRPDNNYDKIKVNQQAPSSIYKTETICNSNNSNSHKNGMKEKEGKEENKINEKELKKKLGLTSERSTKNKLLQSIEKRLEKLRSFNNSPTVTSVTTTTTTEENNDIDEKEKKSNVETAIKRLREQSVPIEVEPCITESGLIKRAVSVEDFPSLGSKQLQTSKKSVTKILNLFKKYEEKDKKNEKQKVKNLKDETCTISKSSINDDDKYNSNKEHLGANNSVISGCENASSSLKQDLPEEKHESIKQTNEKSERPRSLLFEKMKHFQNPYSGARSDSLLLGNDKTCNKKSSKLPINSFRRSLNLENISKNYKSEQREENLHGNFNDVECEGAVPSIGTSKSSKENINGNTNIEQNKFNRKKLHLDLSNIPNTHPVPSINIETNENVQEENSSENKNSFATDDSSLFLSPGEDVNDTWSVCSDYHTQELTSPVSPTGQFYSADEGESVIDRIRRKSFYTRFNEKKRPRKTNVSNYRDLDFYKNIGYSNSGYRSPVNYAPLGKKSSKSERKVSYPLQEPSIKSSSNDTSSLSIHNYVNLPRYNTYHPRSSQSLNQQGVAADTIPTTIGKSKTHNYTLQYPSKLNTRSLIPNIDRFSNTESSANNNVSSPSVQSSAKLN